MTVLPKTIDRIGKLLRLAAPSGGSTEAERTSAALEAAKLISEHGLVVAEPAPPVKPQRPPQPRRARPRSRPVDRPVRKNEVWAPVQAIDWAQMELTYNETCVACGGPIWAGEEAFFRRGVGYRHYDISCDE